MGDHARTVQPTPGHSTARICRYGSCACRCLPPAGCLDKTNSTLRIFCRCGKCSTAGGPKGSVFANDLSALAPRQQARQFPSIDRLDQVMIDSFARLAVIVRLSPPGHRDDQRLPSPVGLSHPLADLEPAQSRHAKVQEQRGESDPPHPGPALARRCTPSGPHCPRARAALPTYLRDRGCRRRPACADRAATRPLPVRPRPRPARLRAAGRLTIDKLATLARRCAAREDVAVIQVHDPRTSGKADVEPALCSCLRRCRLRNAEHRRQHVRLDADAVVPDRNGHAVALTLRLDLDAPAVRRVFALFRLESTCARRTGSASSTPVRAGNRSSSECPLAASRRAKDLPTFCSKLSEEMAEGSPSAAGHEGCAIGAAHPLIERSRTA